MDSQATAAGELRRINLATSQRLIDAHRVSVNRRDTGHAEPQRLPRKAEPDLIRR